MQRERGTGVVAAVLVAVVILSGAIFYRFSSGPDEQGNTLLTSIIEGSQQDTDGDGLTDTEEEELGTDPKRKDTDGDGTDDYREALTGRNPLVQGPYDVIDDSRLSTTDMFIDDLVVGYGNILDENGSIDYEAEEAFIESISNKYSEQFATTKAYSLEDLNTIGDSPASRQNYKVTLKKILRGLDAIKERETTTMLSYYETQDPKELEKIDHAIKTYDSVVEQLVAMPVPEGVAPFHLPVVNGVYELNASLVSIRLAAIDPLHGIIGANTFLTKESELIIATVYLGEYLAQNL